MAEITFYYCFCITVRSRDDGLICDIGLKADPIGIVDKTLYEVVFFSTIDFGGIYG